MNFSLFPKMNRLRNHVKSTRVRRMIREFSSKPLEEIEIPARIERSSTDILKALAGTVGTDYTAPHYRYHDDPWLIPYTQNEKRDYLLAKESGRNAARFILENHPHLFTKNRITADPPVTAFQPRAKYNRDNVTVELLDNMIQNFQVSDAVNVYELLKEKKKQISSEQAQALLELLAFYSEEEEPLSEDNRDTQRILPEAMVWVTGGLAEKLYSQLGTPQARLAMLLGLARHKQPARTLQVWGEVEANKDAIPVEGFNAFISTFSIDDTDKLRAELTKTLERMRDCGVVPDPETLVVCLQAVARTCEKHKGSYESCCELTLALLAELRLTGVEPCLGALKHLLDIFYSKGSREKPMILKDVLQLLEGKDMWPAKSTQDFKFFLRAMEVCNYLNNTKLAYRLHNILLTGNNINLIGNFKDSERYYELMMLIVLRTEQLDTALQLYDKLAPHVWSPRRDFFMNVLHEINLKAAVQYIGKIYDDMELGSHGGSSKEVIYELNTLVLRCMDSHPPSTSQYNHLSPTYIHIAKRIFKHLELNKAQEGLYLRFNTFAAGICNLAMKVLLREGQFESACEIFNFCVLEKERMPGQLSEDTLQAFVDAAIEEQNVDVGLQVVDYLLSLNSPKSRSCGEKLASLDLSDHHKITINKLFSHDPKWARL